MPSYTPEFVFGYIRGTWPMQYGLLPWPKHLQPRAQGKLPTLGNSEPTPPALPDINLRELFNEPDRPSIATDFAPVMEKQGGFIFLTMMENDRPSIATTIERLINMLDDLDEDPDLEPYLAGLHQGSATDDREADSYDNEPSLGWTSTGHMGREMPLMFGPDLEDDDADRESSFGWQNDGSQQYLTTDHSFEREDENEHGGDIQDQPHDAVDEGNDEPFLGWPEKCGQGPVIGRDYGPGDIVYDDQGEQHRRLAFDGGGTVAARAVLRNLRSRRPDVQQNHVGGWHVGAHAALQVDGIRVGGYRETATRLPDATIMRSIEPRDGMIPEIDMMAHYRAAHGHRS